MPHWERSHPYRDRDRWRLSDAARLGQLVIVKCNLCRRVQNFLASDLVLLFDPDRDATEPPFACSKCQRIDYISVRLHVPEPGDYGHLLVRRPAGVQRIQKWRTAKLGD